MPNIGIVGAENSHTVAIARTLNIQKLVRGFRVTHVWGELLGPQKMRRNAVRFPILSKIPKTSSARWMPPL